MQKITSFPEDEDSCSMSLYFRGQSCMFDFFFPTEIKESKELLAYHKGPKISVLISYRTVCLRMRWGSGSALSE